MLKRIDRNKPVRCKNGLIPRILCWDGIGLSPIIGQFENGEIKTWSLEGKRVTSADPNYVINDDYDLINTGGKIKIDLWANVYSEPLDIQFSWRTKEDALRHRLDHKGQHWEATLHIQREVEDGHIDEEATNENESEKERNDLEIKLTEEEIWNRSQSIFLPEKEIEELLAYPRVSTLRGACGNTPLHYAAEHFKEVLKHPDAEKVKNKFGKTPADFYFSALKKDAVMNNEELNNWIKELKNLESDIVNYAEGGKVLEDWMVERLRQLIADIEILAE